MTTEMTGPPVLTVAIETPYFEGWLSWLAGPERSGCTSEHRWWLSKGFVFDDCAIVTERKETTPDLDTDADDLRWMALTHRRVWAKNRAAGYLNETKIKLKPL